MSKFVLDSWTWIEYFEGSLPGEKVKQIILDSRNEVFTHCATVAEIISRAKRSGKDVDAVGGAIKANSKVLEANLEDSKIVGITHAVTILRN
jgi:hypothetical protein